MTRHIKVDRSNPAYWVATLDNPPINLVSLEMIDDLSELVGDLESDPEVRVIVFRSADPDFFLAHYDLEADSDVLLAKPDGPTGLPFYSDALVRLARVPVATIAEIDGRVRGAGSEIALSCDMRFGSLEGAVLGQFEVGVATVPGGNPMAMLARLMGRGRTMEAILGADDFDGATAERYGYINRALPRAELAGFVDGLARRIAGFEKAVVAGAKAYIDEVTTIPDDMFKRTIQTFFGLYTKPASQDRLAALMAKGLQKHSDVELHLGRAVAE